MLSPRPIPWWAETPWWESPVYPEWLGCTAEELHLATECLKTHFDRAWWESVVSPTAPYGNPVAGWLLGQGLWPCQFIYSLGTSLHRLRDCCGLDAKVRELKQGLKARSILFEIEIAAAFAHRRLAVRFPAEADEKSPDMVVTTSDGDVAVECKCLEEPATDEWTRELISLVVPMHLNNYGYEIELAPGLSFLRKERPEGWNGAIARALASEIQAEVSDALNASPPPEHISLPGVARIRLVDGMAGRSSVSGSLQLPAADMRRLVEHAWSASRQVPHGMPGVIVMQCPVTPGQSLARAALSAAVEAPPEDARVDRIAAFAIMPGAASLHCGQPVLVNTPHFAGHPAVATVLAALKPA